jgi:hypothetical protein
MTFGGFSTKDKAVVIAKKVIEFFKINNICLLSPEVSMNLDFSYIDSLENQKRASE